MLLQNNTIGAYLDTILAAEKSRTFEHVTVTTVSSVESPPTTTRVEIRLDRKNGRYLFDLKTTGGGKLPLNRVFYVSGAQMLIYNPDLNQYVVRKLTLGKSVGENLISTAHIDPGVLMAVDPDTANRVLFANLRKIGGWAIRQGAGFKLSHSDTVGKARRILSLSATSASLPTAFGYQLNAKGVESTFAYGAEISSVSYQPPASSRKMPIFLAPATAPRFKDSNSANLARQCNAAYLRLKSFSANLEGAEAKSIAWQGRMARQSGGGVTWAYDGTLLTVIDSARRRFYRGKVRGINISDYLQLFNVREDSMLRDLLLGESPLEALYGAGLTGRLAGSLSIAGVPIDILELNAPTARTQVEIRSDTHLIAALRTENLSNGAVISRSSKALTYTSVNTMMGASAFRLSPPTGYKIFHF
jgi:hypothetical protein